MIFGLLRLRRRAHTEHTDSQIIKNVDSEYVDSEFGSDESSEATPLLIPPKATVWLDDHALGIAGRYAHVALMEAREKLDADAAIDLLREKQLWMHMACRQHFPVDHLRYSNEHADWIFVAAYETLRSDPKKEFQAAFAACVVAAPEKKSAEFPEYGPSAKHLGQLASLAARRLDSMPFATRLSLEFAFLNMEIKRTRYEAAVPSPEKVLKVVAEQMSRYPMGRSASIKDPQWSIGTSSSGDHLLSAEGVGLRTLLLAHLDGLRLDVVQHFDSLRTQVATSTWTLSDVEAANKGMLLLYLLKGVQSIGYGPDSTFLEDVKACEMVLAEYEKAQSLFDALERECNQLMAAPVSDFAREFRTPEARMFCVSPAWRDIERAWLRDRLKRLVETTKEAEKATLAAVKSSATNGDVDACIKMEKALSEQFPWASAQLAPILTDLRTKVAAAVGSARATNESGSASPEPDRDPVRDERLCMVICASPIPPSAEREAKEELERFAVLREPLPLGLQPSIASCIEMESTLLAEFPWAKSALEPIFLELRGRAGMGLLTIGMQPTLLVGDPGAGKSRLANRLASLLAAPILTIPAGGEGGTKALAGMARGWSGGRANDIVTLMASRRTASVVAVIDELDKAGSHYVNDSGLHAYLLNMLEPETSRRHRDSFLKTDCNLSAVMWIATANSTKPIPTALLGRFRMLHLAQPTPNDFPTIAENVIADLAREWGIDRFAFPSVAELKLPFDKLTSARQVRLATQTSVTTWSASIERQ